MGQLGVTLPPLKETAKQMHEGAAVQLSLTSAPDGLRFSFLLSAVFWSIAMELGFERGSVAQQLLFHFKLGGGELAVIMEGLSGRRPQMHGICTHKLELVVLELKERCAKLELFFFF